MAGIGGDLAGLMSIMQRNKALREEKRQWNEGAEGRALVNEGQRLSNETAQSELDSAEALAKMNELQDRGVLDAGGNFTANVLDQIENSENEEAAIAFTDGFSMIATRGMQQLNQLDPNQKISGYSKTSDGQYILEIEYTDGPKKGTIAPLTRNGTSEDDDPVQPLTRAQVERALQIGRPRTESDANPEGAFANNAYQTVVESTYGEQEAEIQNVSRINEALNEKSGGKAASRAFMSSVFGMELSEQQAQIESVAKDLGIELIPMSAPQELTAPNIAVAGQPSEERPASRGRLEIAGDMEQDGRTRREESRIAALPGKIEKLQGNIALLEERGVSEDSISMRKNREALAAAEADLAAVGGEPAAPKPTGNPAVDYMATQRKITDTLETMTPEQIASGDFSFITPEDRAATIGMLKERQIASSRDIKRLPPKEQAMAWATLAAYAPSEGARTAATNNLRNITETGVASVSAKDLLSTTGNKGEDSITASQAISNLNEYRKTHTDEDGNFDTAAFMRDAHMLLSASGQDSRASGVIQNEIAKQVQIALQEGANEGGRDDWFEGFINMFTSDALIDSSSVDFSKYRKVVDPKDPERILKVIHVGNDGKQKGGDINIAEAQEKLGTSIGLHLILDKMDVYQP